MKKILLAIVFILIFSPSAFAEKIPVRIENTSVISTHHDEVQLGDAIPFKVVNDVYLNKKLYIKKDTKVLGIVDFVQDNGWAGYVAEIRFKRFLTKNTDDKVITIESPITLDGNADTFSTTLNYASHHRPFYSLLIKTIVTAGSILRGHEIKLIPQEASFNIFIEQ